MALTQRQILDNTPGVVKLRTKICSIRLVGAGKHIKDKKLGNCYELLYNLRCLDGNRFVKIRYIGSKKPGLGEDRDQNLAAPSEDSEVWISCTCPYHMYTTEYALSRNGSSSILFGNGEPARMRNPDNIGYVCKHGVLALTTAVTDDEAKPPVEPEEKTPVSWRTRMKNWLRGKDQAQEETPEDQNDNPPEERQPVQQPTRSPVQQPQQQQKTPAEDAVEQPQQQTQQPVQQPVRNTQQQPQKQEQQQNQQEQQKNQKPGPRSWKDRLTNWLTGKK